MRAALSNEHFKALQIRKDAKGNPFRYEEADNRQRGLKMIVHPTGRKTWILRFWISGKKTSVGLGDFRDMSLANARAAAKAEYARVDLGQRPLGARKTRRDTPPVGSGAKGTVRNAYNEYRQNHIDVELKASTARTLIWLFERKMFPAAIFRPVDGKPGELTPTPFGDCQLHEVTQGEIFDLLQRIKKKTPTTSNRALAALNHFFKYCVKAGKIGVSPTFALEKEAKETPRERKLSDDEIRWFWQACVEEGYPFGHIGRLLLVTATRLGEMGDAVRSEFNFKHALWTLPGERTKNHREHEVALSPFALSLIEQMPRVKNDAGFMFCTNGLTASSGYSKAKARIETRMLEIARAEAITRGENPADVHIRPWRLHDLRHTARTNFARLGVKPHIGERCLNHVSSRSKVEQIYDHHSYSEETRAAFNTWSAFLESLVSNSGAKVLPLRRGAA